MSDDQIAESGRRWRNLSEAVGPTDIGPDDLIIIDDPVPQYPISPAMRQRLLDWYEEYRARRIDGGESGE